MPGTAPQSINYPREGAYGNIQGQRLVGSSSGVSMGSGVQPIGGSTDIELMRSLAGVVRTNEAMVQELKGTAHQLRVLNERTSRTMGSAAGAPSRGAQDTITLTQGEFAAALQAATISVVNEAAKATNMPYYIPTDATGAVYPTGNVGNSPVGVAPPRDDGMFSPPSHGRPPTPEAQGPSWDPSRRGNSEYNIGFLRQGLATKVGRRLSEAQWTGGIEQGPFAGGMFRNTRTGGLANEAEIAGYMRRQRVLGAARGVVGQVAEGGSIGEGLASALPGAARFLGGAAGAVGLVNQAANFAEGQRSQNAEWQSIMGGSNAEGFVERARSRRFALNQMGVMGTKDAQELYMGVARTGLRGQARDRATDFATDAYRNLGMSIQESVALVNEAARNGVTSFGFLAQSLRGVTKAAREAGVNAQAARQQFTQNMGAATDTFGMTGAAGIAQAQTQASLAMGREIGGAVDFSAGNNDTRQLLMQAAQQHISINQLVAQGGDPNTRGTFLASQDKSRRQWAGQFLGALGQRMVAQAMQANGGRGLTEEGYRNLARDYMRGGGTFQVSQLPMVMRMMGVSGLTMATVIPFLMKTFAGSQTGADGQVRSTQSADQYADIQRERGNFDVGTGGLSGADRSKLQGQMGIAPAGGFFSDMSSGQRWMTAANHVLNPQSNLTDNLLGDTSAAGRQKHAASIHMANAAKTGRAGGIEAALASKNYFAGDRRIRVQTANGPRLVTTDDALRYYGDQIARGDAEIVSGANAGQTVAEAVGMQGNEGVKVTSDTNKGLGKHGKADDGGSGGKGNVTITLSPELRRWFAVNGTGIASTNPSTALAPPSSRTTANGLTTDSGR